MRLEEKMALIQADLDAGKDPPEGAPWGGKGIQAAANGDRFTDMDHCTLREVLVAGGDPTADGSYGIYTYAHAGSLSRFP